MSRTQPCPNCGGDGSTADHCHHCRPEPPDLYWSATLARNLNLAFGVHPLHGLIDPAGPTQWCDDAWEPLRDGLPADALRLASEPPL